MRAHGDEVYRVTRKPDGHWLWCDRDSNQGGDNIDLVRELEPGTGYAQAVYRLAGAPAVRPAERLAEPKRQPPTLPLANYGALEAGRDYLCGCGIAPEIIEHAEVAGMVRYAPGAVLFVGYDAQGTAQAVTWHATDLADDVQRRDLRGTDKRYPPILAGDPRRVWIAEGGLDALALHTIYRRRGEQPPTVIVGGGANVTGFLDRPEIQQMLRSAERVTVAGENEKDAATDAAHLEQCRRVSDITGCEAELWRPKSEHSKGLADYNVRQIERMRQEAEREMTKADVQRLR